MAALVTLYPPISLPKRLLPVSLEETASHSFKSVLNFFCQMHNPFHLLPAFQKCHVTVTAMILHVCTLFEYLQVI